MELLVLGGTAWLGRAVATQAVARGHRVTCLARGDSGPVAHGAELVVGDRLLSHGYDGLAGRSFDALVDVSRQPEQVRTALSALTERVGQWSFVSTCSVYADDATPGQDERAPVLAPWIGTGPAPAEEYGPAKVACEDAVREARSAAPYTITRPGLIVGDGDPSDRFGYWPGRVARAVADGGPILVPPLDTPVQVIDVLDFARWLVFLAETDPRPDRMTTYNAMGDTVEFAAILDTAAAAAGTRGTVSTVEVSDGWLEEHGVEPWAGADSLPLWLPATTYAGFMHRRNEAAKAAGLRLRPIADSIHDALRWEHAQGLTRARRAGLSPLREGALIRAAGSR